MYRAGLAAIHHRGFTGLAREAGPDLLGLLDRASIRRGSAVVDLGCGSGVWLGRLARAGYRAQGIERSVAMARIARTVARPATIRVGSLHRLTVPRCRAITALGEVLSYLPAPPLAVTLRRLARALEPGGLLIFDLMIRRGKPARYRTWTEGPGWLVAVDVVENDTRTSLIRRIEAFSRVGRAYRRDREVHRLRVVSRSEVIGALTRAGFRSRVVTRYGSYRLAPGRLGFVATLEASR